MKKKEQIATANKRKKYCNEEKNCQKAEQSVQ